MAPIEAALERALQYTEDRLDLVDAYARYLDQRKQEESNGHND